MEVEMNGISWEDKTSEEPDILLSCALICDARDGYDTEYKSDPSALKLYYIYRHWTLNYLLYLFIFIIHSLAFIEPIGITHHLSDWDSVTTTLEIICLIYFVVRLTLRGHILPSHKFWRDTKHLLIIITVILTTIDLILYYSFPNTMVRWSTCLRPVFIINSAENRQVSASINSISI